MRSCVVTRERRPPAALIRLVVDQDRTLQICSGSARSRAGRGAWIVPEEHAFAVLAERPQVLRRSLRAVPRQLGPVLVDARAAEERALENLLRRCWRSGLLRLGEATAAGEATAPAEEIHPDLGWTLRARPLPPTGPSSEATAPGSVVEQPRRKKKRRRSSQAPRAVWPPPLPSQGASVDLPWSAPALGVILGRPQVKTLQLRPGRPARALLARLQRRHGLGYAAAPSASPEDAGQSSSPESLVERVPDLHQQG